MESAYIGNSVHKVDQCNCAHLVFLVLIFLGILFELKAFLQQQTCTCVCLPKYIIILGVTDFNNGVSQGSEILRGRERVLGQVGLGARLWPCTDSGLVSEGKGSVWVSG